MIKNILKRIFGCQTGEVKVEPRITRIPLYVANWRFSTPTKPAPAPRPFMRGNAGVGNPPPKVRQDSRPQPPWKRGS